jgi:hypothetical protein
MLRRYVATVLLAGGLAFAMPGIAVADGVKLDLGRINIDEDLERGGSYRLPDLGVSNPGSNRSSYEMFVGPIAGSSVESVPESWLRFEPASFSLGSGETQTVSVTLTIPTVGNSGEYRALLGARTFAVASGEFGAGVGAGAAADLTFEVAASSALAAWTTRTGRFIGDYWPYLVGLAGIALLLLLGRRYRFRVERR